MNGKKETVMYNKGTNIATRDLKLLQFIGS